MWSGHSCPRVPKPTPKATLHKVRKLSLPNFLLA